MNTMVNQLEVGKKITGFYVCARKIVKVDRNSNRYIDLRLSDSSGAINGKMWDVNDSDIERFNGHDIVKVQAVVSSGFRGDPELKVERIRAVGPEDEYKLEDLLPVSPRDPAEMEAELAAIRGSITNTYLAVLLDEIFTDDMYKAYCEAPAAKGIHHNYIHGLLEHSLSVSRVADAIAGQYEEVNRGLLVTGALLHDIGKTVEFDYTTAIDYSDSGRLLGHIVLGEKIVADAIARLEAFPEETALQLLHLILSHHGEKEYGSPIRPKTPEAFILNHADDIDAKANIFQRKRAESDEPWSEFNRPLDRFLYLRKAED
jgi:3'-5' exoribonuclease